jgi:hypothetical protein
VIFGVCPPRKIVAPIRTMERTGDYAFKLNSFFLNDDPDFSKKIRAELP